VAVDHPILRIEHAAVQFGALHVLGPLSFEVKAGQCVVLLGPSGCGKSTLLAALAGLQALSGGRAYVGDGNAQPGFVFQDANLLNWGNALDNVALPLALAGLPKSVQTVRAMAALQRVGLAEFAATKPRALSGGMAMRVALARALVTDPIALLLDEPFAAIDELGRRGLNDLVLREKIERNVAILFVTHSVEEAVYMGDTILVMSPRPGQISARIDVPAEKRDGGFVVSPVFGETVSKVRRALSAGANPA
jgi:NitT/TauT family transport system ATP-binding protein